MLFKSLMKIILCILGLILVIQGLDLIFNFGIGTYLFLVFWLVVSFELGAGFCRYSITDNKYIEEK